MVLQLPLPALFILQTLRQNGFEAYIVGGAVRDLLRAVPILEVDFDFTTNALPDQIQALFPNSYYDNEFGTVAVTLEHLAEQMGVTELALTWSPPPPKERIIDAAAATKLHESLIPPVEATSQKKGVFTQQYEITTYRSQELYEGNFRRPSSLEWGKSLEEDVSRRDFTINALALSVSESGLARTVPPSTPSLTLETILTSLQPGEYDIFDFYQGKADLDHQLLKTVGDPTQRFQEDALRMLRAIRFAVQLNFEIDSATFEAIKLHADLIQHISWERIRDEFLKMLASPYPAEAIELLDQTGLLSHILPELQVAKGVEQGGHHTTDVWVHSLDALAACPSLDPIVRLATLLHDIAKPLTFKRQNGTITFYNHEIVGARMVKNIARRLRLSNLQLNRLFVLVRYHMFHYQPHNTDAAIRRFMRKVGLENLDDILDVREADRLGSGARKTSWRLEEMKQRMIDQLHQPLEARDLAIDGHDLMQHFQLKPGPILGELLQTLLERVIDNPELNTSESLFNLAGEYLVTVKKISS